MGGRKDGEKGPSPRVDVLSRYPVLVKERKEASEEERMH